MNFICELLRVVIPTVPNAAHEGNTNANIQLLTSS